MLAHFLHSKELYGTVSHYYNGDLFMEMLISSFLPLSHSFTLPQVLGARVPGVLQSRSRGVAEGGRSRCHLVHGRMDLPLGDVVDS